MTLKEIDDRLRLLPEYIYYRAEWMADHKMHRIKDMYLFYEFGILPILDKEGIQRDMLIRMRQVTEPEYGEFVNDVLMEFDDWYRAFVYERKKIGLLHDRINALR